MNGVGGGIEEKGVDVCNGRLATIFCRLVCMTGWMSKLSFPLCMIYDLANTIPHVSGEELCTLSFLLLSSSMEQHTFSLLLRLQSHR